MEIYRQLYAYLVSQIDEALFLLDTGNLLATNYVKEILSNALLEAENRIVDEKE